MEATPSQINSTLPPAPFLSQWAERGEEIERASTWRRDGDHDEQAGGAEGLRGGDAQGVRPGAEAEQPQQPRRPQGLLRFPREEPLPLLRSLHAPPYAPILRFLCPAVRPRPGTGVTAVVPPRFRFRPLCLTRLCCLACCFALVLLQPIEGFGVARVIDSDDPEFKPGDLISGMTRWEEYSLIRNHEQLRKIDPNLNIPLSYHLGLLGISHPFVFPLRFLIFFGLLYRKVEHFKA